VPPGGCAELHRPGVQKYRARTLATVSDMARPGTDRDRRARLLAAKLRALIASTGGGPAEPPNAVQPPGGAAGLVSGDAGWYLADVDPVRALGGAMAWFDRAEVRRDRSHVVIDGEVAATTIATRLAAFQPRARPAVWRVRDAVLDPVLVPELAAAVAALAPAPHFDRDHDLDALPAPDRTAVAALLDALGAVDAVAVERDWSGLVLTVRGLEIARVVAAAGGARLDVGVGRFDRDARRELRGSLPLDLEDLAREVEAVRQVASTVLEHRRAGAPEHPLRSVRAECWLRSRVMAEPALAGLDPGAELVPVAPPVPTGDLAARSVAVATSPDAVVVTSVGIDIDLVPAAAHAWMQAVAGAPATEPRLVIAVPARDLHPVHHAHAAGLDDRLRVELVGIQGDWRGA